MYKFADEVEPALEEGFSVEELQALGSGLFIAELQSWADSVVDASANVVSAVQCKHASSTFTTCSISCQYMQECK